MKQPRPDSNDVFVQIFEDEDLLAKAVAMEFRRCANEAIARSGRFSVALSGGTTPRQTYLAIAQLDDLPWAQIHLFWSDERCVSADDPHSNFAMAEQALIAHVPIPLENVHRIPGELGPEAGTLAYQADLERFFGAIARFDLIHLGLGSDGHVASLFPGQQRALETTEPVIGVPPNSDSDPQVDRITLSFHTIHHASELHLIVARQNKAEIVRQAFQRKRHRALPIHRVHARIVRWFLDKAAAQKLHL